MESEDLKNMHRRIVKCFIDILVLSELKNRPMSGYDVITFLHDKFGILVSSGTVYSLLYSLERDELIEGRLADKKRVYELTERGNRRIELIQKAHDKIQSFVTSIFKSKGRT